MQVSWSDRHSDASSKQSLVTSQSQIIGTTSPSILRILQMQLVIRNFVTAEISNETSFIYKLTMTMSVNALEHFRNRVISLEK